MVNRYADEAESNSLEVPRDLQRRAFTPPAGHYRNPTGKSNRRAPGDSPARKRDALTKGSRSQKCSQSGPPVASMRDGIAAPGESANHRYRSGGGHVDIGAQERSSDETACGARLRASLDRSEHHDTPCSLVKPGAINCQVHRGMERARSRSSDLDAKLARLRRRVEAGETG